MPWPEMMDCRPGAGIEEQAHGAGDLDWLIGQIDVAASEQRSRRLARRSVADGSSHSRPRPAVEHDFQRAQEGRDQEEADEVETNALLLEAPAFLDGGHIKPE